MLVNSIYATFQGEVNKFGIGHPVIFLRLQGCPIRCYKRTIGILCDTPEALKKPTEKTEVSGILDAVKTLSKETGIKIVTLTGGDPLWNNESELIELFKGLTNLGLSVSVETSGTISWLPYCNIDNNKIFFVLDYKLKSAGIKDGVTLFDSDEHLTCLTNNDYIKFVIYDDEDLKEAVKVIGTLKHKTKAVLSVGAYWGGKISTLDIFKEFLNVNLAGNITINAQLHKLVVNPNMSSKIPLNI